MDRSSSMRWVDSLGKQWCNNDPVGVYIHPEELSDCYRVFQPFRIRGGGKHPVRKSIVKPAPKRAAQLDKLEAKTERLEKANKQLAAVLARKDTLEQNPIIKMLYEEFQTATDRSKGGEDVLFENLKKKDEKWLEEWVKKMEGTGNGSWRFQQIGQVLFQYYDNFVHANTIIKATEEDMTTVTEDILENAGYRNMYGNMQWQSLFDRIHLHLKREKKDTCWSYRLFCSYTPIVL